MCIGKINVPQIVDDLTSKKLYRSERQLQLDIGCGLKKSLYDQNISDWRVEMEYLAATVTLSTGKVKNYYIDIALISDKGEYIPIELKYKTKAIPGVFPSLKNQGAQDFGRYDYLLDVSRIESLKLGTVTVSSELKTFIAGYAIMVTNDRLYYDKTSSNFTGAKPAYADFCIGRGQTIAKGTQLKWNPLSKSVGGRSAPITLNDDYTCKWADLKGQSKEFKRLILNI